MPNLNVLLRNSLHGSFFIPTFVPLSPNGHEKVHLPALCGLGAAVRGIGSRTGHYGTGQHPAAPRRKCYRDAIRWCTGSDDGTKRTDGIAGSSDSRIFSRVGANRPSRVLPTHGGGKPGRGALAVLNHNSCHFIKYACLFLHRGLAWAAPEGGSPRYYFVIALRRFLC